MARTIENTPLAQNPAPTAQEVFDAVARHASQMPERCYSATDDSCLYRNGTNACFVGALLTDDEAAGLDDREHAASARDMVKEGLMPARLVPHEQLLQELQEIHDLNEPDEWPEQLRYVAEFHELAHTAVA
ncbi:hypothetical protein [Methylorubrum populi]|uniref:hypothetical protein n=1 Tax=Methylorubrum populi TaxID=223967 RepID=UPI000DB2D7B9|nr:hypothetical protein [Methylorubrum populi]PZP71793.1 MAG: hypothetical protein DI590_05900 [Methylorubrum populi]